jgi:hypothetical protein
MIPLLDIDMGKHDVDDETITMYYRKYTKMNTIYDVNDNS